MRSIYQRALHPDVPQVAEAFGQKRARAGDQILQQPVKAHGGVQRKEQILSQALVPAPVHRDDEQDHEGLLPQEGQRQHDLIHHPAADLRQLLDRLHDGVIKGQAAFQQIQHRSLSFSRFDKRRQTLRGLPSGGVLFTEGLRRTPRRSIPRHWLHRYPDGRRYRPWG